MGGLSQAPQGSDNEVRKQMITKADSIKFMKDVIAGKPTYNINAMKQLDGAEATVANNWLDASKDDRNKIVDGLIAIQKNLENAVPVPPKQLEAFQALEKVLPKVFGTKIDKVMGDRKYERTIKMQDEIALKKAEDAINNLPDEKFKFADDNDTEAEDSFLDGMSANEIFKGNGNE